MGAQHHVYNSTTHALSVGIEPEGGVVEAISCTTRKTVVLGGKVVYGNG